MTVLFRAAPAITATTITAAIILLLIGMAVLPAGRRYGLLEVAAAQPREHVSSAASSSSSLRSQRLLNNDAEAVVEEGEPYYEEDPKRTRFVSRTHQLSFDPFQVCLYPAPAYSQLYHIAAALQQDISELFEYLVSRELQEIYNNQFIIFSVVVEYDNNNINNNNDPPPVGTTTGTGTGTGNDTDATTISWYRDDNDTENTVCNNILYSLDHNDHNILPDAAYNKTNATATTTANARDEGVKAIKATTTTTTTIIPPPPPPHCACTLYKGAVVLLKANINTDNDNNYNENKDENKDSNIIKTHQNKRDTLYLESKIEFILQNELVYSLKERHDKFNNNNNDSKQQWHLVIHYRK